MKATALAPAVLQLFIAACHLDAGGGTDDGLSESAAMQPEQQGSRCGPASSPILLSATDRQRIYSYAETVGPTTFSEERLDTPDYDAFLAYLNELNGTTDVDVFDQRALLERQRDVFVRFFGAEAGATFQMLLDDKVGQLSDVTCLQSIFFDLQNHDWPLSEGPVEMAAIVLERSAGESVELRAYIKTQAQSSFLGVSTDDLMPQVEADLAAGWDFLAHMHSHPLFPDNELDIAGTVLPSINDVEFFRILRDDFGLKEAWITNGIDSAGYTAEEFDLL